MSNQIRVLIQTLQFFQMGSFTRFLFQRMVSICGLFLFYIQTLMITLFGVVNRVRFRVDGNKSSQMSLLKLLRQENRGDTETEKTEDSSVIVQSNDTKANIDCSDEEESPKSFLKFQFRRFEEFINKNEDDIGSNSVSSNKYEVKSGGDFRGFTEEPEVFNFRVSELYADSNNDIIDDGFLPDTESVHEEKLQNSIDGADKEEIFIEESLWVEDKSVGEEKRFPVDTGLDCDSDSIASSSEFPLWSPHLGSISDFSSDNDSEEAFELDNLTRNNDAEREKIEEEEAHPSSGYKADDFDDEHNDSNRSGSDTNCSSSETKQEENGLHNNEHDPKVSKEDSSVLDSEDSSKLETLWEHQEFIEQLKMEIRKVRATGLPTILEEGESPKIMDDLKPWKIDEKFQHVDTISELHRFYRSYRERMRKFNILNYQKMYAIGVLQSKDLLTTSNSSFPALLQNFKRSKSKAKESDPTIKFIRELHSDLEVVYVGQMCLSWEILHWQYKKSLELWESDQYGILRYNEVAGEFQQFQVLMQRFIENEAFEEPRVQNYVQKRCVSRNLVQVPVIREDKSKDKRKRGKDGDAITSDMLVEIMEESIRIFWQFVRADKDANTLNQKRDPVEGLDQEELELLAEIQASLRKKEKMLKEILRSGNCILRKCKKKEEEGSVKVLYFFSQVDMKLVARVLNMSTITRDQLVWCHNKLSKISFVNRKLRVDPSFSLFPC